MKHALMFLTLGVVAVGAPAYAHHSFAADYFEQQMVSIEGEIDQLWFRNPHSLLTVMANDSSGQLQKFTGEWGGITQLSRRGVTTQTLKPGDHVIVRGSPGHNPEDHKLHVKGIQRPADGWQWPLAGDRGRR